MIKNSLNFNIKDGVLSIDIESDEHHKIILTQNSGTKYATSVIPLENNNVDLLIKIRDLFNKQINEVKFNNTLNHN